MTEKKQSISAIREIFAAASETELPDLYLEYEEDSRAGVQNLIQKYQKQEEALKKERERTEQMKIYEHKYEDLGWICGIAEVGRGPLAGPVVAGAVILPRDSKILYLNDSKQLSAEKREQLYDVILEHAVAVGIGIVSPQRIDEINILQATYEAMRQAIEKLNPQPAVLLNDAVRIPQVAIQQVPIIKGDAKSVSIAAASIVAKVTRDRMMEQYEEVFPGYGFARNKGYGSKDHIEALQTMGPTAIHRRSFIGHFVKEGQMNKRQVGAFWEEAVTAYLMRSGVNILERNYRCSRGEIDIIGFHRGCLVFFEVKYRNDDRFGTALEAVGSAKQEKICRCADWYLWKHPAEGDVQIRFDVVAVCRKEIQWIQNAFEYRRAGTWNSRRRR